MFQPIGGQHPWGRAWVNWHEGARAGGHKPSTVSYQVAAGLERFSHLIWTCLAASPESLDPVRPFAVDRTTAARRTLLLGGELEGIRSRLFELGSELGHHALGMLARNAKLQDPHFCRSASEPNHCTRIASPIL